MRDNAQLVLVATDEGVFGARAHSFAISSHKAGLFGLKFGLDSVCILGTLAFLHSSVSEMAFNLGMGSCIRFIKAFGRVSVIERYMLHKAESGPVQEKKLVRYLMLVITKQLNRVVLRMLSHELSLLSQSRVSVQGDL